MQLGHRAAGVRAVGAGHPGAKFSRAVLVGQGRRASARGHLLEDLGALIFLHSLGPSLGAFLGPLAK